MLTQRRSGILLHPTSLPGSQHCGSLGVEARNFIDLIAGCGQSVWQVLPLNPTGHGNCPYSCFSAFAGNPLLINLIALTEVGDLTKPDLPVPAPATDQANFAAAMRDQYPLLRRAWENFQRNAGTERRARFMEFCTEQSYWLDDYALFETLRANQGQRPWHDWPEPLRQRDPATLARCLNDFSADIHWHKYMQYIFYEQWFALTSYARQQGVRIMGDLPIFVAENSADVWSHRELFHLDEQGRATLVAGVPPDYFSATGQRWGNPLYCWERLRDQDFSWWRKRFAWNFKMFDLLRVDHFRGFSACWAIPAADQTAENGYWLATPGRELFIRLQQDHGDLPILAEDLGIITADVVELRQEFALPGMKILQFAFDSGADNPYLPHNHSTDAAVYTGTHDNDTSLGWWHHLDAGGRERVKDYLRRPCQEMPWPLIETALASVARLAIIPLQDILALPSTARMNTPGTATGNWSWRYQKNHLEERICERLRHATHLYGRDLCFHTEIT
ncbi:MAG: 4-alpha-glucanotransferase [Pelovirga sp.]